MENFDILTLSYLIPIFSLLGLVYRFLIFKYWDIEILTFGVVLGWIPILNVMIAFAVIFCFIGDFIDTPKTWNMTTQELNDFAIQRTSGGWEY